MATEAEETIRIDMELSNCSVVPKPALNSIKRHISAIKRLLEQNHARFFSVEYIACIRDNKGYLRGVVTQSPSIHEV